MIGEWRQGDYRISTDPRDIDFATVHAFLAQSYWSPGISRAAVERNASHSRVFGLYHEPAGGGSRQVGYARVLTDYFVLAYVFDVFILEAHRGRGLARWLMATILADPALKDVAGWMLKTRDAHGLYQKLGFAPPSDPERFLRRAGNRPA